MTSQELLSKIETFLDRHVDLNPTLFGKLAVNDGKLIGDLRKGRRLWPETQEKILSFMRDYQSEAAA